MENNLENINDPHELINKITEDIKNNVLKDDVGRAINAGLDVGIRAVFPAFVEDQIINLKDNIYNYGFKEGVSKSFNDAINLGKSTLGILTGNFESVSQARDAIKSGGIIDNLSDVIDDTLSNLKKSKVIDSKTASTLKKGKNEILNNIEENIEKKFDNQLKSYEKLEKYIDNWKENFKNKDFDKMEKEYIKMKKVINDLIPVENNLSKFRTIENLQNLIKNNGKNFNLSDDEMELANKLLQ